MTFSGNESIKFLLASNAIFFTGFLLYKRANWPLVLLVLLFGVQMSLPLIALDKTLIISLNALCAFAYGPTLLALVRKLAWRQAKATSWWHWIVTACVPVLLFFFPVLQPSIWPLVSLSLIVFFALILWNLSMFQHALEQNYSDHSHKSLQWLKRTLLSFAGLALIDTARMFLRPLDTSWRIQLDQSLSFANLAIALILLYWLIWRSMQQQLLFEGIDKASLTLLEVESEKLSPDSNPSSGSTPDRQQSASIDDIKMLETCMEVGQAFLRTDLNLQQLASMLDWHPKKLSSLINAHYQKNFNDFVNQYRVKHACHLLGQVERRNEKLISIQLDSGFASKSVFNAQFKKLTGLSPTEYRRRAQMDDR